MNGKKKFKILIVDDERSNIDALAHILRPNYGVFVAKDGKTAIEVARMNKPDLILLDIVMPDMTGFEVIVELKNSDITRGIPVIFITALNNSEDEEKGLLLGAVDYITKPFHSSIVQARVGTHLKIVEYIRAIERLGMVDALTDIPNRRGFEHQINVEWGRAIREKTPIGMLMIDVDKFKSFNDKFGHLQGDIVLKAISKVILRTLERPADLPGRLGGDEFAVLLPDTDLKGVLNVAEKIRANIESETINCVDGTTTGVTISIGVNSEIPTINDSITNFIAKTDKALYKSKNAGRNMVSQA